MILLNSEMHQNLKRALETEKDKNYHEWNKLINAPENSILDGFLAILDYGFDKFLIENKSFNSFNDWLFKIGEWLDKMLDPRNSSILELKVLYPLWERFSRDITNLLRRARLNQGIPKNGGFLVFIAGLSKCLIMNYEFIAETPRMRIVTILENPKSAFDFWEAIDQVDMSARNSLKSILWSGHKIVIHRNVLIHIDRRNDVGVFGPSIDTLLLSEILAQDVFGSKNYKLETAMEIGSGNGLLTAMLYSYGKHIRELISIDISPNAVACTTRNVFGIDDKTEKRNKVYFITGSFKPGLINKKFDLIVCNPPYIPIPKQMGINTNKITNYLQAVGGIDLIYDVVNSAQNLLNQDGRILLMTSNLSLKEILLYIPSNLEVSQPLGDKGFEVLFDVEAVFNHPEWLLFLTREKGLVKREDTYFHVLHPLWIRLTNP